MIQFFVVFHSKLFDDLYSTVSPEILDKYFTFIAVNKDIPKRYTKNKYKVINEWELPIYDSSLQELGYRENSAIYHVYINNLHKNYSYVGFMQYDMRVYGDEFIAKVIEKIDVGTPCMFGHFICDFNFAAIETWNELETIEHVIRDYESFFNTTFDKNARYPLYNTYLLPVKSYEKVMKWVSQLYNKIYPACNLPPNNTLNGHLAGIYERVMAFAIAQEHLPIIDSLSLHHDHYYRSLAY